MELLNQKLKRAFDLTVDLAESLSQEHLKLKLPDLPSNSIGHQFWCVIGARESFFNAIQQDKWIGFDCSLSDPTSKNEIIHCLNSTSNDLQTYLSEHELSETQLDFLLNLLEHEIQHHGQLIRYIYGNRLKFPQSWNERYTV